MKALLVLATICAAMPAFAQGRPSASRAGAGAGYDPNHMVCRNLHETGSRLSLRRVCMTQAEWDQQRRETRANVDRAQTTRVMPGQ